MSDGASSTSSSTTDDGGSSGGSTSADVTTGAAASTTTGDDASTGVAESSSGDTGTLACAPPPERMLVLGDSILACAGQPGGRNGAGCSARMVWSWLEAEVAPGIQYENLAVGGAVTADITSEQLANVTAGRPGHTLVLIGVGGNDMQRLLGGSDSAAEASFDALLPTLDEQWTNILAFFDDPANFPDGVTLVVNNQYNPFDDCTATPYLFMSPVKTQLLHQFNEHLSARLGQRDNVRVVDLHGAFLGHGQHYRTQSCPYYDAGADYWMIGGTDLIHPGTAGHAGIAASVRSVLEELYVCE